MKEKLCLPLGAIHRWRHGGWRVEIRQFLTCEDAEGWLGVQCLGMNSINRKEMRIRKNNSEPSFHVAESSLLNSEFELSEQKFSSLFKRNEGMWNDT